MSTDTSVPAERDTALADAFVGDCAKIETLTMQLAIAVRTATANLAAMRQAVWQASGNTGLSHIDDQTSPDRFKREVAGALVAAGLREVLVASFGDIEMVSDFASRWQRRVDQGGFESSRRRKDHSGSKRTNPQDFLTPGQHLAGTGPSHAAAATEGKRPGKFGEGEQPAPPPRQGKTAREVERAKAGRSR